MPLLKMFMSLSRTSTHYTDQQQGQRLLSDLSVEQYRELLMLYKYHILSYNLKNGKRKYTKEYRKLENRLIRSKKENLQARQEKENAILKL